ncbi:hypothetical protein E2C01_057866 [Portunus trituberculatus]|uniref:Uncharacterized protein n=1 Tax=Portunus trituberculatus TaxID=210409 RepID=A0A5B7H155_PORTR|nr:hypothetical protein [Portunus trituberculatus]
MGGKSGLQRPLLALDNSATAAPSSTALQSSANNITRTLRLVRQAYFSSTYSRRQWESLLGVLNFAAPTLLLGRLKHRRLTKEVNLAIPRLHRDLQRSIPRLLLLGG